MASASAAVSTLLITIVAARSLVTDGDAAPYASFVVFWSLLFGFYGVVNGMYNETTRAVNSRGPGPGLESASQSGVPVFRVGLLLSACTALATVLTSPWWGPRLVADSMPHVVYLVAAGLILYGLYQTWLGAASGLNDWPVFSWLMILDAAGRLGFVIAAAVLGAGLLCTEAACVLASLTWVLLLVPMRRGRRILRARADVGCGRFLHNCLLSMVSSTSTAILVTAFPTIIKLTSPDEEAGLLAGTITAISLTRSPIMIPLLAFQGVAITAFLSRRGSLMRALAKPLVLVGALGVICAALMVIVGPWVLRVLYDPSLVATGATFAGLTLAAVPLAFITLTGAATVAASAHRWFSAGWFAAALVSTLLMFLPFSLPVRACIALSTGPLAGAMVHLIGLHRTA
ncbi:hypothetical protein [Propionibacterium australiense]|uniref:Polysaccharide biosynthesis protein n=1 Tax=Propionibacterium australiense TaxID=119981 RepID=A0A383S4M7_9ACTN|nr:hypothetical protein [Propionibacterium australiense]RLP08558.1 hypothetical protein D9T14_08755 [Propionibacterium australiense]RLP08625.1 hypothetical protein D7U36_09295 [Propionibacterium australiense]SYZ32512.1 Hypothetical protein PROPAUS_0393 [Propionibacterium australiense]VEH88783.1 Uncharacterised protein [Propionibacterium australiense]